MPEKFSEIEEAVLNEYSKVFDIDNDKMFWSKMLGHINGDSSFVVPSISQANAHSSKFDKTAKHVYKFYNGV